MLQDVRLDALPDETDEVLHNWEKRLKSRESYLKKQNPSHQELPAVSRALCLVRAEIARRAGVRHASASQRASRILDNVLNSVEGIRGELRNMASAAEVFTSSSSNPQASEELAG